MTIREQNAAHRERRRFDRWGNGDIWGTWLSRKEEYTAKISLNIEKIPAETMHALVSWHWPGNIREIENFIERAVILSRGPSLCAPMAEIRQDALEAAGSATLEQVEREHIVRVLRECAWSPRPAVRLAGGCRPPDNVGFSRLIPRDSKATHAESQPSLTFSVRWEFVKGTLDRFRHFVFIFIRLR
jgi:hypothetical protein